MHKKTSQLRRGDLILALDGHKLHTPVKVNRFVEILDDGTVHVEVEQPKTWITSPSRWLRHEKVEFARPVTLEGVKLLKLDDDLYRTPDGEYEIYRDDTFLTECDAPHPCRLTDTMRSKLNEISRTPGLNHREAHRRARVYYGPDAYEAWLDRRKGWHCPGGEEHVGSQWVAWTGSNGDWSGEWSETATEAAYDLARHLGVR